MVEAKTIDDKGVRDFRIPKDLRVKVRWSLDGTRYISHIKDNPKNEEIIAQHCASLGKTEPADGNYELLGGNPKSRRKYR